MPDPTPPTEPEPHFIGWLPMPRSYARLLVPVAAGLVVAAAVTAALIARGQQSPGDGRWEDGRPTTLVGVVYAEPYAMIRVPGDGPGGPPITVLLVEEGKFGAKDRVRSFDGRAVRVTGTPLTREGWRMLELTAGEEGLRPANLPEPELAFLRRSPPRPQGRVTLRGEIVDSKCFLGAMKPGGGRTHRGCARLCLKGGVPPLFVSRSGGPGPSIYLLASEALGPADDSLLELAGLPVVVDVYVDHIDDVAVLRLASHNARAE
ncbi:MAG: hypothetical protein U0871_06860 [Gemmataceae bacterium]